MLAAFTYTTNFTLAFSGDWNVVARPMHHLWSLAVEEQFYLVWPLLVLLVAPKRLLWVVLAIIALAPVVRMALHVGLTPLSCYVLVISRMDSLAIGALVAILSRREEGLQAYRRFAWIALAGGAVCIAAVALWRGRFPIYDAVVYVGGFSLVALVAAALLVLVLTGRPDGRLISVLEHRWLAALGLYSYAVYVFHQPVYLLITSLGVSVPSLGGILGSGTLGEIAYLMIDGSTSFTLAYLSWHLYEQRFLQLKRYFI